MSVEKSTWERPKSVPVPTVWRKYEGLLQMPDGKKPQFIIQDLNQDYLEEALHLMTVRFCKEEAMFGALNITEDATSLKELQLVWRQLARQNAALVALVDDGSTHPRVAGVNLTYVFRKQDRYSPDDFRGVAMKRMIIDGFQYVGNCVNVFERYGVTEFLSAFGLYVHPDFRGQGLGTEILRTRTNIGKALGLKVTMSFFSTTQGQQAAEKAGMELLAEVPYTVFKTEDGREVYTNMNPKTLKIMAMRFS